MSTPSERAERMRLTIMQEFADAYPDDAIPEEFAGNCDFVLRAIVETLGLSWADVRAIQPTPKLCESDDCEECHPARAIRTLLEASGITPDGEGT